VAVAVVPVLLMDQVLVLVLETVAVGQMMLL
jgi:hypothetical protein